MLPDCQGSSITLFNFEEPFAENSKYVLTSPRSLKVEIADLYSWCFRTLKRRAKLKVVNNMPIECKIKQNNKLLAGHKKAIMGDHRGVEK